MSTDISHATIETNESQVIAINIKWDLITSDETAMLSIYSNDTDDSIVYVSVAVIYDQPYRHTITLTKSPDNGGSVSGDGKYTEGEQVTVTASPNFNYTFNNWSENGNVISYNKTYTFQAQSDRNLCANFTPLISTDDKNIVNSFQMYPNPVSDRITINCGHYDTYNVVITDLLGRIVFVTEVQNEQQIEIDFTAYPTGIYYLTINENQHVIYSNKFIKQ